MALEVENPDLLLQFLEPSYWHFQVPKEQYYLSAWDGHVPFLRCLTALHKPRLFVELGTHRGLSFHTFCYTAKRLGLNTKAYAVDTWAGDAHAYFYSDSMYSELLNELSEYKEFATLKKCTFNEALKDFDDKSIDLLHIDGFHTYEAVKDDFETYLGKMSDRGIVIFHDTNVYRDDFGVWRFWQEVSELYPHFNFMHGHGLGVLYVGQRKNELILKLIESLKANINYSNFYKTHFQCIAEYQRELNISISQAEYDQKIDELKNNAETKHDQAKSEYDQKINDFQNQIDQYKANMKYLVTDANAIIMRAQNLFQSRRWLLKRYLKYLKYVPRDLSRKIRGKPSPKKKIPVKGVSLLSENNYLNVKYHSDKRELTSNETQVVMQAVKPQCSASSIKCKTAHMGSYPIVDMITDVSKSAKDSRFNIVITGFQKNSFFGGKATALRLAIEYVLKNNIPLRIIACAQMEIDVFDIFLEHNNLQKNINAEFLFLEDHSQLPVGTGDIFLCTMWSNLKMLKEAGVPNKIFYIMQEVETFFYDHGDLHLDAYLTLSDKDIYPIVNTKLLYDYFVNSGYENVIDRGIYFEPAFSQALQPSKFSFLQNKKVKKIFFFARPSHQRNLFYFCFNVLNEAFNRGILKAADWIIYTAGDRSDFDVTFDNSNVVLKNLGVLSWSEYYQVMSEMDLCFSVIYTPHPSYPPFDAACSGAVVLTNQAYNKKDLAAYSKNIICAKLTLEDMLEGFNEAVQLVNNITVREDNFRNNKINRDWSDALSEAVAYIENKVMGTN